MRIVKICVGIAFLCAFTGVLSLFAAEIIAITGRAADGLIRPDFTRGAWKTAKPLGIETINMSRMGA